MDDFKKHVTTIVLILLVSAVFTFGGAILAVAGYTFVAWKLPPWPEDWTAFRVLYLTSVVILFTAYLASDD